VEANDFFPTFKSYKEQNFYQKLPINSKTPLNGKERNFIQKIKLFRFRYHGTESGKAFQMWYIKRRWGGGAQVGCQQQIENLNY
jgi:hypothetical protein